MAGIFKAYDIRGIVGDGLTAARAYLVGRALAETVFGSPEEKAQPGLQPIVVSHDMRTHSPELTRELVRGLCEGGCSVIDIGLAATPMNYWANVHYQSSGSVTVTASHNGPQYNGFKVSAAGALPVDYATGLDRVEAYVLRAEAQSQPPAPTSSAGTRTEIKDALTLYLDFMNRFVQVPAQGEGTQLGRKYARSRSSHRLKIGIDTANGMGGFFLPAFFARYDWVEVVPLYWELDGTFPNHEADPLKEENLRDVQKLVTDNNCDFGVAYDGDADRCMFVDEVGCNISSDLVTALIAAEMLERNPGQHILYDLRSSRVVPEWIAEQGGVPVRGRVGHSFMKRLLRDKKAPFGGELSGHYYFADCFHTDSGLMAMIQVMNIWHKRQHNGSTPLSQLVAPLRKYSATGEMNFRATDVPGILARIEEHYGAQGARLDHLDGLTVEFDDWWFNLRSSNTEPLLRLNLEASDEEARDNRLQDVKQLISSS